MKLSRNSIIMSVVVAFAITLFVSIIILTVQYLDEHRSEQAFEELEQIISVPPTVEDIEDETEQNEIIPTEAYNRYDDLYELNPDFVGWISIDGTELSYPVMQSIDSPNYYLKRNFDGEYSDYGVPYVDEKCGVDLSNNIIIYGHSMTNGSMFDTLLNYADEEFYKQNPVIHFDTLSGYGEYKVLAVFKIDVAIDPFFYTTCTDMDEEQFDEYLSEVRARAMYDTGVEAEFGDMLITLSTCEYTLKDGRFVVVGVKNYFL